MIMFQAMLRSSKTPKLQATFEDPTLINPIQSPIKHNISRWCNLIRPPPKKKWGVPTVEWYTPKILFMSNGKIHHFKKGNMFSLPNIFQQQQQLVKTGWVFHPPHHLTTELPLHGYVIHELLKKVRPTFTAVLDFLLALYSSNPPKYIQHDSFLPSFPSYNPEKSMHIILYHRDSVYLHQKRFVMFFVRKKQKPSKPSDV